MTHKAEIKKVLVVLSPDLIKPDQPQGSPLIQRAVSLARFAGCELELFHVCHDSGLEHQLFESDADLQRQREALADRDMTQLAEIATRLKSEGINVRYEARWDSPRTDAILRKIAEAKPDIVMKQAREHSFVLGITSNTDWDLARRCPADVWLVNEKVEDIDRIITAVGNKLGSSGDITTAADYGLLQTAGLIGDAFNAGIYPVNAYQVPDMRVLVTGMGGAVMPVISVDKQEQARTQIVKQHSDSVKALTQSFNILEDNVHIREGHPNKVIPDAAESIGADMIVMGASSIGRLERLVSSVTVEPVMADTNTDYLVVGERDLARVPAAGKSPIIGAPKHDLENAITNPDATFDSPQEVADLADLSIELRNRILQAWEYDIRAEMVDENEGGPIREIDVNALDAIYSAKAFLHEMQREKPGNGQVVQHGMSA